MAQSAKAKRNTTWTFTCYPESLPTGWQKSMSDLHVPLCYILHDKDTLDNSADMKKPHYHVLVKYDSLKCLDQVKTDFAFTGIEYFEPVRSFKAMCRYLCHADNPDKAQYSVDDIVCLSGISLDFSRKFSRTEELSLIADMTEFIEDNDIHEFAAVWNYSAKNNLDWLSILSSKSAYGISQYIRSRRCAKETKRMREQQSVASPCM